MQKNTPFLLLRPAVAGTETEAEGEGEQKSVDLVGRLDGRCS